MMALHPPQSAMTHTPAQPKPQKKPPADASKDKRLAEALRQNLLRRKAASPPKSPQEKPE